MKPDLVRHLEGEKLGRFPVWMMRQAGRYLPEYRALRQKHSFWEMVSTPHLASEVSLMPLSSVDVDAVIFFSDILTLPYGLGIEVLMKESIGPVITKPLRSESDFQVFGDFDPAKHTAFVGEALKLIASQLEPKKTLIGFAGAPWTVSCYLVEGQGKSGFNTLKDWNRKDQNAVKNSLKVLASATTQYLKFQIASGAKVVQLFDTWLGEMSHRFFVDHYIPILNQIFTDIRATGVPIIYFGKNIRPFLPDFYKLSANVIGVDESISMTEVEKATLGKFSLQGNLPPALLKTDEARIRTATRALVDEARALKKPAILNLGHGIFPDTPVANAQTFVQEAKALWI